MRGNTVVSDERSRISKNCMRLLKASQYIGKLICIKYQGVMESCALKEWIFVKIVLHKMSNNNASYDISHKKY